MNNNEIIKLSKKGYEEYIKKIHSLREELNKNSQSRAESFDSAVGDGWHDNFEYEDSSRNEKRILKEIQDMVGNLNHIVIVDDISNDNVIGSDDYVCYYEINDNNDITSDMELIKIVASFEPDIFAEIPEISINSPIGEALYGSKIGEIVSCLTKTKKINLISKFKSQSKEEAIAFKESSDGLKLIYKNN